MSKRFFLLACAVAALMAATAARTQSFDLVVANGRVIDPESNLDAVRSVGIANGRIAAIASSGLAGRRTIDATGLVVAPGFIDLHAHGQEAPVYALRAADGVTTALELEVGTSDIDRWYGERRNALINYGVSIGHIQVRMAVLRDPGAFLPTGSGAHQPAGPADVSDILRRLERGVDRGAVSIGAGFVYTPAAARDELIGVFRIAAARRVPVTVHIRRGMAGLREALALAAESGAPLHVVHINSTGTAETPQLLEMIAAARAGGMDVTTEAYPYDAGMTEIKSANLDEYERGPDSRLALLEWPPTGERLTRETFRRYRGIGGPVVTHTNTEEMVAVAINSPLTAIASDAYWENGVGHPRTTGTYSRVLGHYVREAGTLSLMEAVRKMTLLPAQRLERTVPMLGNKGRLRVGADADITVFDPATIADRSTYREPALPPIGIRLVVVHGVPVLEDGRVLAGVSPGRPVRGPMK